MTQSRIEWTDRSDWNPIRGCTRVSEGCRNCYAERIAARFSKTASKQNNETHGPDFRGDQFAGYAEQTAGGPRWTGLVELQPHRLDLPLRWKKPARIFVNSMSDLFHESLSIDDIAAVFAVMAACPQHVFQVLTKRPERMRSFVINTNTTRYMMACKDGRGLYSPALRFPWPLPNVWLGVSVEDQNTAEERIPLLLQTPAAVRFVSYEPALGPVDFAKWLPTPPRVDPDCNLVYTEFRREPRLDWIIAGGESGPGARPAHPDWFRSARDQCQAASVAYFMKQVVEGGRKVPFEAWPDDLRVREFPRAER